MDLTEATEQDIKDELHRREVVKKQHQIESLVTEINMALASGKISDVKWENFEGKHSNETKYITVFFK